ncbi:hypothetical protein E2K99_24270 [Herbaspirillum huttiense]|uniref:hypothetical protein n=1 Tax=Herbaspirillum huttiense TaxID=863372 RepID=UPI00106677E6|nr:hypothetical protein [Herbaspirillum huttiense]QBP77902.1 hypothetical protein E2K99_24270 [Herbaspirillum huttiense]
MQQNIAKTHSFHDKNTASHINSHNGADSSAPTKGMLTWRPMMMTRCCADIMPAQHRIVR